MIFVLHLGALDYGSALKLQEHLVDLRKDNRIGDVLLLLEHPPVITLGRNASETNIVASREFLANKGVEVFEINRGGDVTFHGPGQLVGYPIFDLRGFPEKIGVIEYIRSIEDVLIRTCIHYGIETQRIQGMTGVWTRAAIPAKFANHQFDLKGHVSRADEANAQSGLKVHVSCADEANAQSDLKGHVSRADEANAQSGLKGHGFSRADEAPQGIGALAPGVWSERKIAAIGVHISRAVTSHGFALNVTTDLDYFKLIVPCGLAKPVTSIEFETGLHPSMEEILPVVTRNFSEIFKTQVLWLESLEDLLGAPPPEDTPLKRPENLRRMNGEDTHLA